jgi:hypothetical protein
MVMTSCGDQNEYWDISKFKMDNNALKNNEEIKLIYTSQSPDGNKDLKYYLHYIAVSQETNDTVNILSTANFELKKDDGDKIFNFFDKDNLASKLTLMDLSMLKDLNNDNINNVKNNKLKDIKYVIRNPKFDDIADNKYSTIIGSFGVTSDNK